MGSLTSALLVFINIYYLIFSTSPHLFSIFQYFFRLISNFTCKYQNLHKNVCLGMNSGGLMFYSRILTCTWLNLHKKIKQRARTSIVLFKKIKFFSHSSAFMISRLVLLTHSLTHYLYRLILYSGSRGNRVNLNNLSAWPEKLFSLQAQKKNYVLFA